MTRDSTEAHDRERQLDDAVAEYLEAVDAGRRPDPAQWLTRFPELAPELARFFADQDQVHGLLGAIAPESTRNGAGSPAAPRPAAASTVPYFGDYELIDEVARGGMGVVYRARQVSLNRTVALKMILAGRLASIGDVQRFRNEAEAAAQLDHPNIVPIYEINEHEGQHYFTMKYIEGGSLAADRIRENRIRDRQRWAAQIMARIARAVHYAHQHGILHRDLKPANILLDSQGEPHLTDFGLARRLESDAGLTRTGISVGTPSYMAPEQATRPRAATTAADVYSLGAILYELLTGRPPFRAEHPLETLRQVLEREPARPRAIDPRIDRDLETICLKCLEKDPARRYAGAQDLAEDLERFLRAEPVHARRVGAVKRLWRWCRRRPLIASQAAALIVSLAAGTGLITWQWLRAEAHLAQVEQEWTRAEKEWARAEEERKVAEAAFQDAHKAVNQFCTEVAEGPMRDMPGLQPQRRELLESALAYYQRFLKQRGHDPALRRELADTYFRVATLSSALGPKAQALDSFEQARAVYEDLRRSEPASVSLRHALAGTHARIGLLHAEMDHPPAALAAYREAVRLYEELLVERPHDSATEHGLAAVLNNLGSLHRYAGRVPDGLACLRRSRDLQEELVRNEPTSREFRGDLAMTCSNLAGLEAAMGRWDEGLALYESARDRQEKLIAEDPANLRYQQELATTYRQLGGQLCVSRKFTEAHAALKQSQGILEKLIRAEPGIARLKCDRAAGCRQTGHIYRDSGMLKEALEQYETALAIMDPLADKHPEIASYRNDLAKSHFDRTTVLSRLGMFQEALVSLEAAAKLRRALVEANPSHVGYQSDLGMTLGNLCANRWNLGRHEDALAAQRESLRHHRAAFDSAPELARNRRFLAGGYSRLTRLATDRGHYDEAIAAALEWKKLWPNNVTELVAAAAALAEIAEKRPMSAGADLQPADLAVAVLREAIAAGFRDSERLRTDSAFAPLRGRADFDSAIAAIEAEK